MKIGFAVGDVVSVQNEEQMSGIFGSRSIREAGIPQIPIVVPFRRSLISADTARTAATPSATSAASSSATTDSGIAIELVIGGAD